MKPRITVTGRLEVYEKNKDGSLRKHPQVMEPIQDRKPIVLDVVGDMETLKFGRHFYPAIPVRRTGRRSGNTYYLLHKQIGAEFDQRDPGVVRRPRRAH